MDCLEKVNNDILRWFFSSKLITGSSFSEKDFFHHYAIKYNNKKEYAINYALVELAREGLLEHRNGKYFLTKIGEDIVF